MNPRLLPTLTAGLLGLLPLAAQTAPRPEPPKTLDLASELDEIVNTDQIGAASKHVQDVASAPADVVVIRASELKALGYRTLGDALGGVLGLRGNADHAYQGLGAAGGYILGDQNTRILILLDGHALNSPAEVGSSKVGEDFGLPLELVDHIEVVRGPASSLYGNNAFQALVNVVSTSAAGTGRGFQGAVSAGSRGLSELWAQQTVRLGGVTTSLMVSGFQRKGTALDLPELQPQALPADADREERQSAYLYVKGSDWSLAASALSRVQHLASGPYGSVAGDPANFYRNRRLSGDFKWEPSTGDVKWMFRLFGDRNEFFDSFTSGAAPTQDRDPDRSVGLEAQGRTALSPTLSLTFGTEQQFHRYNGVYTDPDPSANVVTEVAYSVGNTYLEGNWHPTGNWNVVAGLQRADWRPSQIRSLSGGVWQDQERDSISRLTPRLSVIWKSEAKDVLKFIYGQGFRFPTIFERYYTDGSTQAPNPYMKPEVITSEQVSWSRKWSPQWTSHLAASLYTLESAITAGSDSGGLFQYQNSGQRWQGRAVEAEASWHHGATEVSGGAGWYQWQNQGVNLANIATWNGLVKAIRHAGAWSLAGEARYLSGRENPDTLTRVPANWTLRASVRRELAFGWTQLTVEDLTDSRRRDLVAPEYTPVTWMAADGRALRVVVGVRF